MASLNPKQLLVQVWSYILFNQFLKFTQFKAIANTIKEVF